jgi:hypothetical protein
VLFGKWGTWMKATIAGVVGLVLALSTSAAMAEERAGDAALGALSGAVVLGPIGAVAGAFVGYAAGPSIARSWGLRRSTATRPARRPPVAEPSPKLSDGTPASRNRTDAPAAAAAPASAPQSASTAPPVQPLE